MTNIKLYSVTVTETHPPQCIAVWDSKDSADKLADFLNSKVNRKAIEVKQVDSFFPRGMTDCDAGWNRMTESYLQGNHRNTTGNPA